MTFGEAAMPSMIMITVAVAALAAPHAAVPQNASQSEFVSRVQACQQIKDNAARLTCYDGTVAALVAATSRGDVTIVDRNQMRQVRRSLFGFSLPRLPFFSGSKDREVQEEPKELVAKLISFHDIGNGFFRFTLDEPQSTWESTEASSVYSPRAGDKVTIQHGALGSYFVEIGNQPWVRARRIR
jgi:hypothetical protein